MKTIKLLFNVIITAIVLCGCTPFSEYVRVIDQDESLIHNTSNDEATIFFIRPKVSYEMHQAPIFDTTLYKSKFVGILQANTKMVYKTRPGFHIFMVVYGKLLPFPPMMQAGDLSYANFWVIDLLPGETYYVRIKAFTKKASIDFVPINLHKLEQLDLESDVPTFQQAEIIERAFQKKESDELIIKKYIQSFKLVENTDIAYQWVDGNMARIERIRKANYDLFPEKMLLNFKKTD